MAQSKPCRSGHFSGRPGLSRFSGRRDFGGSFMPKLVARIGELTETIRKRSAGTRARYLEKIDRGRAFPNRKGLGCANQAHAFAACVASDKERLRAADAPNLAIVTAYNDM